MYLGKPKLRVDSDTVETCIGFASSTRGSVDKSDSACTGGFAIQEPDPETTIGGDFSMGLVVTEAAPTSESDVGVTGTGFFDTDLACMEVVGTLVAGAGRTGVIVRVQLMTEEGEVGAGRHLAWGACAGLCAASDCCVSDIRFNGRALGNWASLAAVVAIAKVCCAPVGLYSMMIKDLGRR